MLYKICLRMLPFQIVFFFFFMALFGISTIIVHNTDHFAPFIAASLLQGSNNILCKGDHMVSSAIWNKWAQVNFLKAKICARSVCEICSLLKIYQSSFGSNCTRKIMWLLVNNIHAKISVTLRFFSLQKFTLLPFNNFISDWSKIWQVNSCVNIH